MKTLINDGVPLTSEELLDMLEDEYPDKMITDLAMSEPERLMLAGKIELIRKIRSTWLAQMIGKV